MKKIFSDTWHLTESSLVDLSRKKRRRNFTVVKWGSFRERTAKSLFRFEWCRNYWSAWGTLLFSRPFFLRRRLIVRFDWLLRLATVDWNFLIRSRPTDMLECDNCVLNFFRLGYHEYWSNPYKNTFSHRLSIVNTRSRDPTPVAIITWKIFPEKHSCIYTSVTIIIAPEIFRRNRISRSSYISRR